MKKNIRKLICFEGMDGSGKSTLSIAISKNLKEMGYSVKYIRWLDGEDTLLKKIIRLFSKIQRNDLVKSEKNINYINGSINVPIMRKKPFYIHFYVTAVLLNYLIFGLTQIRLERLINRYDVFILDRYYFDVILSITREFEYPQKTLEKLINIFKKFLPEPDLFIIILVSSSLAYQRKPDEFISLEQAQIKEQLHNELFLLIQHQTRCNQIQFDNSKGVDESAKELSCRIQNFLLM
jgi:thymidylate kinase